MGFLEGIPSWVIIAVVAFFILRQTNPGGGMIDQILDILRKLFNRPERRQAGSAHECCLDLLAEADHLEGLGLLEEANQIRAMIPKVAAAHKQQVVIVPAPPTHPH